LLRKIANLANIGGRHPLNRLPFAERGWAQALDV
jgi:hypothetical protein